jgi:hypothetical protein
MIKLLCLRPLCVQGERVEPGRTLALPAAEAAHLVDSGKAQLLNEGDAEVIRRVRDEALQRLCMQSPNRGPR